MNRSYAKFNNICNIGENPSFTSANPNSNLIFKTSGSANHHQTQIYTEKCAETCQLTQTPSSTLANLLSAGNINGDMLFRAGPSAASIAGQQSKISQYYNAEKCAGEWDGHCELASRNTNKRLPNLVNNTGCCNTTNQCPEVLTQGQYTIKNALAEKYRLEMVGGIISHVPYNPNKTNSPLVKMITKDPTAPVMFSVYGIREDQIKDLDTDPVMNKALQNPSLYEDILGEIYITMKDKNQLSLLNDTKLGQYFNL